MGPLSVSSLSKKVRCPSHHSMIGGKFLFAKLTFHFTSINSFNFSFTSHLTPFLICENPETVPCNELLASETDTAFSDLLLPSLYGQSLLHLEHSKQPWLSSNMYLIPDDICFLHQTLYASFVRILCPFFPSICAISLFAEHFLLQIYSPIILLAVF